MLHQEILVRSFVLVILLVLGGTSQTFGQEDESLHIEYVKSDSASKDTLVVKTTDSDIIKTYMDMTLEELLTVTIVTAGRREQKVSSVAATVTTITARDIELCGATNLAELLRRVMGFTVERHPGDVPQYTAVTRGFVSEFSNERLLIMVDGIPIYHPHAGGIDPGWLSLSNISKVEVIKGPVSALYGANAFGGIVNLISHVGKEGFSVNIATGTKIRQNLDNNETIIAPFSSLKLSGKHENIDYFFSADGNWDGDGYMELESKEPDLNNGEDNLDLFAKLGLQLNKKMKLSASGLLSKDERNLGSDEASNPMKNDLTHLTANFELELSDSYTLKIGGYLNKFKNYVEYVFYPGGPINKYDSPGQVIGMEIQNTFELGDDHILIIGGDFRKDKSEMDMFGNGYDETTSQSYGVYIQEEYLGIDKLSPIIGLRYDHNSEYGDAVSPRIGLSYQAIENIGLYITVGRAFRAPSYNELYFVAPYKIGNAALDPEYTTMYEIGIKGVVLDKRNRFNLSLFRHEIEDIILINDSYPAMYINSGDASINGLEAELSHSFPSGITPFVNCAILDSEDSNGDRLAIVRENKVVAGINISHKEFDVRGLIKYKNDTTSNKDEDEDGSIDVLDEVTTMDLFVSKTFSNISFFKQLRGSLFVENLTNEKYGENFPSNWMSYDTGRLPARTFGVKLRAEF